MKSLRAYLLTLFAASLVLPCPSPAAEPKAGKPVEEGDMRDRAGYYSVVFYYKPDPAGDTRKTAEALAKKLLPEVPIEAALSTPPCIVFEEEKAPLKNFPVPEASHFKHSGRGLTDKDIAAMQKTTRATRLILFAPKDDVWRMGRAFTELALQFAEKTDAYIWDSATRECFTRDAWKAKRLAGWREGGVPEITQQTTIHLYQADDSERYLRAITLGMEKFALPDVVIERLIGSDNKPAGNLINLVCQTFAENPVIKDARKQTFKLSALKAGGFRKTQEDSLLDKATGEATLELLNGKRQDGDPENELVEISFANGEGKTDDERREHALSALWGSKDSIVGVKHDEEILAASKRALVKLAKLRPVFQKGLKPGERLMVKAPFQRDDKGKEWMWVEVMKWSALQKVEGILQNDPFYIKALKAGAKVDVNFDELFDYIFVHADGKNEGNETGKLMEKQAGPTKEK